MLAHPLCPQPLPGLIYQWSISGWLVALTLSVCLGCRQELKQFAFPIAKLLLLWGCSYFGLGPPCLHQQPWPGPPEGFGGSEGPRGEQSSCPCPVQAAGAARVRGICRRQQDFSCHLLLG